MQKDRFFLVNLSADPSMNERLVCYLKEMTRVGSPSTDRSSAPHQDLQLQGLGIRQEHCVIEVVDTDVFITPLNTARYIADDHCTCLFNNMVWCLSRTGPWSMAIM